MSKSLKKAIGSGSTNENLSKRQHGLQLSFEAYLTKPFDIPQLTNLIERHLQGMPPC